MLLADTILRNSILSRVTAAYSLVRRSVGDVEAFDSVRFRLRRLCFN